MNKPLCIVSAPVSTRSGYGDHARDLVLSLIKMDKYDVKIMSTKWGNCPMNQLSANNEEHRLILDRILLEPIGQQPDLWIQVTVPNEFQAVGKFNIGITAGIETTVMPVDFVKGCNRMDLILVPSKHAKDVAMTSQFNETHKETNQVVKLHKVETPIEILFEGSDITIYNNTYVPDVDIDRQMDAIDTDFNFLFVGHWLDGEIGQDRKDVGMMIKTFLTVFKDRKDAPGLILKTSRATFSVIDRKELSDRIVAIKNSISGKLPNIYLLHGDLSPDQMNSLYNHPKVNVMLSFTKGEGYGRPLQEFMLSGKPIVAPNWSGHIDFLHGYAELVGGELTPVHKSARNNFLIKGAKWFTVDYNAAAGVIDAIYSDYDTIYARTKKLAKKQQKKFSLSAMDAKFASMMDSLVSIQTTQELKLPDLKLPKLKMAK